MGDIIKFNKKNKDISDEQYFSLELEKIKVAYNKGLIDRVIVIADGEYNCCTSNGITVAEAEKMCREFIENPKKYL